jgi:hypothetical protein
MMSSVWCRDGTDSLDSEEGMLSAVLDMDEVELYLSGRHSSPENKDQLVMPGAQQVCYKYILFVDPCLCFSHYVVSVLSLY